MGDGDGHGHGRDFPTATNIEKMACHQPSDLTAIRFVLLSMGECVVEAESCKRGECLCATAADIIFSMTKLGG